MVAEKVIEKRFARPVFVHRERAALTALAGVPGVVSLLYTRQTQTELVFGLELCARGDLLSAMRSGWRPDAANVAVQLCRALAAVHAAGIVHCDVTLRNVGSCSDGSLRLLDFDRSFRVGDDVTGDGLDVRGAPQTVSPEVAASGPIAYGPPSDCWALGVLLIEVASAEQWSSARARVTDICAELPPRLADCVRGLLLEDPSKRWTAERCTAALAELEGGAGAGGDCDSRSVAPQDAEDPAGARM